MARADSADSTIASDLSPRDRAGVKLFHTPAGLSTERPQVNLPPIDRRALMQNAHRIARQARPHMASYREALTYGLRAAWGLVATSREFAAVRARVVPVIHTAEEIAASRRATRALRRVLYGILRGIDDGTDSSFPSDPRVHARVRGTAVVQSTGAEW
jgi:hypothetical protein